MRMFHFWAQNTPICPEQIFLVQTIIITFIYLLALFTVQNFKKFFQQIQSYEVCNVWAQNGPFPQMRIFFSENLLMSLVSFIHTYLHAKNQILIFIY